MGNITTALLRFGAVTKTQPLYQYDYGQILKFTGVELPATYEVHFSNTPHGVATTMIGGSDGVTIPDMYLTTGSDVYVWLYLHTGNADGETEYNCIIPVIPRASISDAPPTPVQQNVITQAIAALNSATEHIDAADAAAGNANEKAALAAGKAELADQAASSANTAATLANDKAALANEKAALADQKAALADEKATAAQTAATAAQTAASAATTAAQNANNAATYIAPVEASSTAGAAHAQGSYLIYDGKLYQATANIAIGDTLATTGAGANIAQVTGGAMGEVDNLKSALQDILDIETIYSKNLNRTPYPNTYTANGVTFTKNTDDSISMSCSGSPTGDIYWPAPVADNKWLLPAGTYTLSGGRSKMSVDLLLYANKSDGSSTKSYSSGQSDTTFTTTSDYWAWIRFTILSSASPNGLTIYHQLESGDEATEYQSPYGVTYSSEVVDSINETLGEHGTAIGELDSEVDDLNSTVSGLVTVEIGKNKVDPTKLVTGHIQSNGTVATDGAYSYYSTSDYIPLEASTNYVFSCYDSSGNLRTDKSVACALFDESKEVIANSYQNVSSGGYLTFNSGATGKFVRVTTRTSGSYFQLEEGRTTPSSYAAYEANDVMNLLLGDVPSAQVETLIEKGIDDSGIIQYETGKNMVDPAKLVTGYIQSNGSVSTLDAYASYSTSDYIELEASTNYSFTGFDATSHVRIDYNRVACLLFDDAKTPISGTYQDLSSTQSSGKLTFNSSTNAKYARVTTKTGVIFQLEKGTTPTTCEEYRGGYVMGYPLGSVPFNQSQTGNILFGKKWAVCGDSFTDGATDGRITDDGIYKGARYVYPYLIGNRNYMKIEKFFNGGETLAFPAEPGSFTNSLTCPTANTYYQNIPADSDYITIYLGINDRNHATGSSQDGESTEGEIPLGEITDNTTATYYGAWNVVLTWLITNRPHAHIGIIVCNGISSTDTYRQAQIAIAKKYGLPYMDLNGDARTPSMHRTCNPDIADAVKTALLDKWSVSSSNTHPNDAAHLFESTFIENFLRSI